MVSPAVADVYLEELEEGTKPVQESYKMRDREEESMGMGKYPQGLLAHIQQLDIITGTE